LIIAKAESFFDELDVGAEMAADAEGLADFEAGRVISHEAMKAWLLSWGSPEELAPPPIGP
jgi:predicted transcriptional regulator